MAIKKRFWIVILLAVLITSCSDTEQEKEQVTSAKLYGISKDINDLKGALELAPENITLKQQLGLRLYDYYLEQAILKGVSDDNLPFLFYDKKNSAACLLIHGFTATPWELKKLGEYLYQQNINAYGVLVEGHGTTPEELDKTTWQDWYESAEVGLQLISYLTENPYVCGQSGGASLAIMLAEENDVAGIISIASPVYLKDKRANLAFLLVPFNYYHKNKNVGEDDIGHYYETRSAGSIAELVKLIKEHKKILDKITAPILIIQSVKDTRIETRSVEYIYDNIGSEKKDILMVDEPEHVLTTGDNNGNVFEMIVDFIEENEKKE